MGTVITSDNMESHAFSCYLGIIAFVITLTSLVELPCLLLMQLTPNCTRIECDYPYLLDDYLSNTL